MVMIGDTKTIHRKTKTGKDERRKLIWLPCPSCSQPRWVIAQKAKTNPLCKSCAAKLMSRELHSNWKGGRRLIPRGYIEIRLPSDHNFYCMVNSGGYVYEHRLVMAQHLGRPLERWEFVHHRNGIRHDNNIDNLELTSNGAHLTQHNKGYQDGYDSGYQDGYAIGVAKALCDMFEV